MNKKYLIFAGIIYSIFIIFSYYFLDITLAKFFKQYEKTLFEDTLTTITILGEGGWFVLGGIGVYFYFKKRDVILAKKGMFLFLSVSLSGIISGIIKVTAGRARPKLYFNDNIYGFDWWHFNTYAYNSFPSGHTTTGFAVGVAFALLFPKYRVYFILFGFLIAFTRVGITVHYLSDTLFGALIGTITSIYLYKKFYRS
jgi:membrane-associated phospholipid phosphatase